MQRTWVIAIAGGSGSGKTTLAAKIKRSLGENNCVVVGQDSYYIDQSAKFDHDGGAVNFDHPSALDFNLMAQHLKQLKGGQDVEIPIYDFASHKRLPKKHLILHRPIILVDGTLILSQPVLLSVFDESVFIEVSEDIRFQRRLKRDVEQRGRTPDGVREQFFRQVKVMHDEFVEPSKYNASILIQSDKVLVQKAQRSEFQTQLMSVLKEWYP